MDGSFHWSAGQFTGHGPADQWEFRALVRQYTSHTKTMLPTKKSMPRSSRQLDHTKTSWRSYRDANCSGMVMSPIHQVQTILQDTVKGGRRQGRQRKRWEDNIRERTGLGFGRSQRAVENWEKSRKLIAKSSVMPQRPSWLRDTWWWWWYQTPF